MRLNGRDRETDSHGNMAEIVRLLDTFSESADHQQSMVHHMFMGADKNDGCESTAGSVSCEKRSHRV